MSFQQGSYRIRDAGVFIVVAPTAVWLVSAMFIGPRFTGELFIAWEIGGVMIVVGWILEGFAQ